MNMLTSLKALLFSSASVRAPADGAVASPSPVSGAPNFAQLLNGSIADAGQEAAPTVPVPMQPVFQDVPVDPVAFPGVEAEPSAQAVWRGSASPLPPGLALGLLKHAGGKQAASSNGRAGAVQHVVMPQEEVAETPEPAAGATAFERVAEPSKGAQRRQAAPKAAEVAQEAEMASDEPEPKKADEKDDRISQVATDPLAIPVTPTLEAIASPVVNAQPDGKAKVEEDAPKGPASIQTIAASSVEQGRPMPQERLVKPEPQKASAEEHRGPAADSQQPVIWVERGVGKDQPGLPSLGQNSPATPDLPAGPFVDAKPVMAEALALLQIVRDQVAGRQSGDPARVGEQVSAAAKVRHEQAAPAAQTPAVTVELPRDFAPASAPAAPSQPLVPQVSAPVADLSSSLGAQVVDMGVSGQWIDGLARDIAGLSANGAQGRFQINAHQLGAVQVDIRHGSDGAAVNLTVASEAAEVALRQDSDRLKLDASLSAVRIAEVKIERAAPVAEAARADAAGQQSPQQQSQHSSSQASTAWANANQDMSQPQGQQGRWQSRQNNGFDPKTSPEAAVLNHAEARQDAGDAVRARYA